MSKNSQRQLILCVLMGSSLYAQEAKMEHSNEIYVVAASLTAN